MLQGIEPGELGKWLRVVMANSAPGAHQQGIPSNFAEHLVNLRVAKVDANGRLVITDKGRLAVRMEAPDALHKQVDPDDLPQEPEGDSDEAGASVKRARDARAASASHDHPADDHDDCGPDCGHHHHR